MRQGWVDAANLLPSRLTALLTAVFAPSVGDPWRTWRAWRRDGDRHPSLNSRQREAAFAGAPGVRLGGTNGYPGRTARRPVLGTGRVPVARDVRRAAKLSALVGVGALLIAAGLRGSGPRAGAR
jgi:adenosylcobinamide-phosphate synthase